MKRNSLYILFLSIFFFVLTSVLCHFEYVFSSKEDVKNSAYNTIQENLIHESKLLKKEVARAQEFFIAGDISGFQSEQSLFFVSESEVIHWTDYHMPLDLNFMKFKDGWSRYKTSQGVFLIYKKQLFPNLKNKYLIGVVELYRDYQLTSTYLKTGYNRNVFNDYTIISCDNDDCFVASIDGFKLWNFDIQIQESKSVFVSILWLSFLVLGFVFLLLYIRVLTRYFNQNNNYIISFLIVIFVVLITRSIMLWAKFPQNFFDIELFDPQIFASSNTINASFGDLLLNIICVFIILVYAYNWLIRYKVYHQLLELKKKQAAVFSFFFIFLSFLISLTVYAIFFNVYTNSQVNFDITESLHFDEPEFIYLIIFICLIFVFFLVNHFVLRAVYILNRKNRASILIHVTIQIVVFTFFEYVFFNINFWLPLITGLYLMICVMFLLFTNFRRLQYKSYLYLTFTALTCSLIISFTITRISHEKDFVRKSIFADHLILHNDIQGEYLMSEIGKYIRSDVSIIDNLKNRFVAKGEIGKTVKEKYLSNYFDKYEINFSYFNKKGLPYYKNKLPGDLDSIKLSLDFDKHKTWLKDLYFVTNFKKDFLSKYYHFIDVKDKGKLIGVIVVDYTLKKYIARSILPGLLQLSSVEGYKNIDRYNYSIFINDKLQFSVGEFNYNSLGFKEFLIDNGNHSKDLVFNGYHHIVLSGADDKTIIVSSKDDKYFKILTNFSFHFLVLILVTLMFLIVNAIIYFAKNKTYDFSTKIQSYLNAATFAPMIFLSVLILSLIATSYKKDQEIKFKNNADILSSHVISYLDDFQNNELDSLGFKNSIDDLSKYSGTDINIYNPKGRLLLSNQPLLYESGVVSNLINPAAARDIFHQKHRMVQLNERVGDFEYNTVYVSLTKPETSEFLGVMGIPFFNSVYQMDQKKISALAIIINVFAIAFVLLLIGSFFVTKSLTAPLKLIANKLRKVETGNKNEPLKWDADDELGLLVTEYNLMLEKIDDSKKTLVKSEKEQAWKDMAKQVAHEIKNPLTPMKLKLQHLKRILRGENEKTINSIDSLLDQVDVLNDIATSFGSFAKMPIPVNQDFDLSETCSHIISLHDGNQDFDLVFDIEDGVWINGDDKLITRIITNLILNGVQSTSADVRPLIHVGLVYKGPKVVLSIKDNGTGIPTEIKDKVFMPNFTTKYTGSGIGLAVAKNGISQMGGLIWFETDLEKGTVFYIEFNKEKSS